MYELIEELKNNSKINKEKGLNNVVDIDYIIERLSKISVYDEFIKDEVNFVIENMVNDEEYTKEHIEEIMNLSEEDIEDIIDKIDNDDYVWGQLNEDIEYYINKFTE